MDGSLRPAVGILSRAPEAGRSKTRLAAAIGETAAAAVARAMLLDTVAALGASEAWRMTLFVEPPSAVEAVGRLTGLDDVRPQQSGGLGHRMRAAGERLLGDRGSPVVLVGSDIPMLGAEHVGAAIEALGKVDVVLGPASDGGYYLIGFWSLPVAMFDDHALSWGSDRVLETSERIARQQGLRSARITMLHDLDRPSDLATLRKQFASQRATVQRAQRTATVLAALEAASTAVEKG